MHNKWLRRRRLTLRPLDALRCLRHSGGRCVDHSHHRSTSGPAAATAQARDPVCGMTVAPARARFRADHAGTTYYFCSAGCAQKFTADPDRYLARHLTPGVPGHDTATYTCPMHPQIRQAGPGSCPICGMALEPLIPPAFDDDSDVRAVKRKFWICVALSVPVVAIAMLAHIMGAHVARGRARMLRALELIR